MAKDTFRGGVHPDEHKELSRDQALRVYDAKGEMVFLLSQHIGDTIRVSVSADPVEELIIAKKLLNCFGLVEKVPNLISCPTCGRIQYDMLPIAEKVEKYLNTLHSNITVAVMGCPVNGPQEASRADIGIAGGYKQGLLFKKGEFVRSVRQEDLFDELVKEINLFVENEN